MRETVAGAVRAEMARHRPRVTQAQLARALDLAPMSVRARLTGRIAFDVDELAAIAELLDLSPHDLLPAAP